MEMNKQAYDEYVKKITPVHNKWLNFIRAFFCGGIVCLLGQGIVNWLMQRGVDKESAGVWTLLILMLISVILTGLNLFQKIAKFAGAGVIVPITGFANSVVSPAVEFKTEGQIFGIGCKVFTIAGPVIVYGILSSWTLGIITWIVRLFI